VLLGAWNVSIKDDLTLPTCVAVGEPTDDGKKVTGVILKEKDNMHQMVFVKVLSAIGQEKIVECMLK